MRYTVLIVCFLLAGLMTRSQQSPKLKEIVEKFYTTYELPEGSYPTIALSRKLDKWHVSTQKLVEGRVVTIETYLFYDDGYKKLPLTLTDAPDDESIARFLDEWNVFNFGLHPYFGYEGWYKDVIRHYSGKNKLTDDELYSLARAYSSYGAGLIADLTEGVLKSEKFNCPFTVNCLSEQQIKKYNAIMEDAKRTFGLLASRNPKYQTKVGDIGIKHANEYMVQFHSFLTYAEDYSRTVKLPENIYPDSLIQRARAYLDDCPKDAVLITFGDNDTYPLWYLQHQKQFRTDVHVVNHSLLGADIYIFRATRPQFQSKGVVLLFDTVHYMKTTNDYVLLSQEVPSMQYEAIVSKIKNSEIDPSVGIRVIPTWEFLMDLSKKGGKDKQLAIKHTRNFIFKNDMILLDIIYNLGQRKICFTENEYLDFLTEHLTQKGSVWMLNN